MTTSRIYAYRWPARLVSHKPFAAERYFITSACIWQVFFAIFQKKSDFSFLFSSFDVPAQILCRTHNSKRLFSVENLISPFRMPHSPGFYSFPQKKKPSRRALFSQAGGRGISAFYYNGRMAVRYRVSWMPSSRTVSSFSSFARPVWICATFFETALTAFCCNSVQKTIAQPSKTNSSRWCPAPMLYPALPLRSPRRSRRPGKGPASLCLARASACR